MADPTPSWIPSWLQPLWEVFDQAAPLSNFVTIATWLLAGAGAAYLLIGRRLGHKTAIIKHLEKKLAAEQQELLAAAGQSARLEAEKAELSERLAETAIAAAQREWRDGNPKLARLRLQGWLDREGETVSDLLLHKAEWAATRAVGPLRTAGLVAAESFAAAALALWPPNIRAAELASDVKALRQMEDAESPPPLSEALRRLDDGDADLRFQAEIVEQALAAEREAGRLEVRGFYHIALLQIDHVVTALKSQLGPDKLPTLQARKTRVRLLDLLGRAHEALPEVSNIVSIFRHTRGPDHPDTLTSRYIHARVLDTLGRAAEALPIIEEVVNKSAANPELGPDHPRTLRSRSRKARILFSLGRYAEAAEEGLSVFVKQNAHASIGENHPDTRDTARLREEIAHAQVKQAN